MAMADSSRTANDPLQAVSRFLRHLDLIRRRLVYGRGFQEGTMRPLSSFAVAILCALAACGGGGGTKKNPDAAVQMDAPAGLNGLGKKCTGASDCPANASACIGFTQGKLFCSPLCLMNGTGTTGANGQFPTSGAGALNPAPSNATCTGAFTGTTGMPVCAGILATTP